jgi:hypothetical protein
MDRGAWIQTFTGRQFHYADPQPGDIHIEDIAHALSMLCRYAGHCRRFYSVAEHSVLVARCFHAPELRMAGLLHDATEAYCVDIPRPLKQLLPEYQEYENKLWKVIAAKFGVADPLPEAVHQIDTRMLMTERPQIFTTPIPWPKYDHVRPIKDVKVLGWSPYEAKAEFLELFHEINRQL